MKKRSVWLMVAAVIAGIVLSFAFYIDKVTVSASSIALSEQGWKANFSEPLKASAISDGTIYLVDQQGKKTNAKLQLTQNGHSVKVTGIKPGSYILHIKKEAIQGGFFKSMSTSKLSFTVHKDLQTVKSEKQLKDYFAKLKKQMSQMYTDSRADSAESENSMDSSNKSALSSSGGEADHSETNNQVEGVDESDMVKTDGKFTYSILNGRVIVTDIQNPANMKKMAELSFDAEFYPTQLFLHENTLIVLGDRHVPYDYEETSGKVSSKMMMPVNSSTNVRFYDVKNAKNPKLIREIGAEGYLNGARKTGDMLYFVTNVMPNFWAMEGAKDVELRPYTFDSKKKDKVSSMPLSDLSILPGTLEGTYSVITAMNIENPEQSQVVTKGYLGGSNAMYMSKEALYLTAPIYVPSKNDDNNNAIDRIWNPQETNTEIFKFNLDGTKVEFVSSGEVTGMLLNQFSMDEHEGYFRVVTTKGFAWNTDELSENNLYILDAGMKKVGSIEGLAKGERIYSARFMGDKAYMVTFKETDPLFVMDVSNPSAPKVLGELKIPGFSNYLHPLDENHLIGFGYDTKTIPGENGSQPRTITGGMKISLFDVTDFANPKEKDVEILGGQGTYSPLQYDHKALFQHRGKGLYGFPVTLYQGTNKDGYDQYAGEGAMMYEITAEEGIKQVANMIKSSKQQNEDWEQLVQRMVYAGDTLYTISMKETKSYDLNTFKEIGVVTY
ncbi:beta-propeller domain-containing protein [Paenisporosarcina sp. FSL H8-0542]|uniref:beta-propeller domain-containing protein n=1 Tax=Paenisporosarcina sp. FSL H8-0542 TaxID=2921401 RepID=UPI00315B2ECD